MAFLLFREGKSGEPRTHYYQTVDRTILLWHVEATALDYCDNLKDHRQTFYVRKATTNDWKAIRTSHLPSHKQFKYVDEIKETKQVATKATSVNLLVDVFEDLSARKVAITSRADTEQEFIAELSQALSQSQCSDWKTRLTEVLPLVVDLCCKYRGYKAETVQERRVLMAGDLDMPTAK